MKGSLLRGQKRMTSDHQCLRDPIVYYSCLPLTTGVTTSHLRFMLNALQRSPLTLPSAFKDVVAKPEPEART
jgi:hypothetical protein